MSRPSSLADLAPLALLALAEAAWVSVLYGLLNGLATRPPVMGIPLLTAFVVVGIVAARWPGPRLGRAWPVAAVIVVAIAVLAGWLTSAAARAALGDGLGQAVAAHPGGWLAGLAVLRGFADARIPVREDDVEHLFGLGVPGLAVLAVVGALVEPPFQAGFLADTLVAAVVFVIATSLALALLRLTAVGEDSGFDWRRNPAWLGLVLVVLAAAIAVAVNLWVVGGSALQTVTGIVVGALMIVALAAGLDRTALRLVLFLLVVQLAAYGLVSQLRPGGTLSGATKVGPTTPVPPPDADPVAVVGLSGLGLLAAIVAIVVLTAIWMRRTRLPVEDRLEETRIIDRGPAEPPARRSPRRLRRRHDPADAAAAYLALMTDLADQPAVRRDPAETPAEHAARLRSLGRSELSLDLLAADYALVRYAGIALPARETRRAIARWRALRGRLRQAPG